MGDTEKVSMNLSVVDLGQIDLLIDQGFYSSRTDFLRTAIRTQLSIHATALDQAATRKTMAIGIVSYNRRDLEKLAEKGEHLSIKVVGMLSLNSDITPELALATIQSVEVFGTFRASAEVKAALASRTRNGEGA